MKRLFAGLLCLCLLLAAAGCTPTTETVESPGFSRSWVASEPAVSHEVGGLAVDDGWGSIVSNDAVAGSLCSLELDLKATVYTLVVRALTQTVSATDNTPVLALRAFGSDGTKYGELVLRTCDFDQGMTYQEFTMSFTLPEHDNVTLDLNWPGYTYARVSEFALMSKTEAALPDYTADGRTILGVDEGETLTYDESALYYFDLYSWMGKFGSGEEAYDIANLVSTLQGLVNRESTHLFIRFQQSNQFSDDTDNYWLDYLRQEGRMLAGKELITVQTPAALLDLFQSFFKGFAAWDENVPATVNSVATACGADDLLPVRYSPVKNSLYYYLTEVMTFDEEKPLKVDLGNKFTGTGTIWGTELSSTGSRKNDAVLWAKVNYLDKGLTNPHLVAYHVDAYCENTDVSWYSDLQNMYLSNRDYYIANKAFFFDLSPMAFEIPDDDPDQADRDGNADGSIDYQTFCQVMKKQNELAAAADPARSIDVGGFTPWHLKYTRYTNPEASGEVNVEWETVYVFSLFNAYVNADAPSYTAMANASVYMHFPMKESYTQTGDRTKAETAELPGEDEQGANYLIFYMGDFDASAWLNTAMIRIWNDTNRGNLPLCWTFSTGLKERAGHVIDMMYSTATENDYFVAGDNGVGYLNPESFFSNRLTGELAGMNGSLEQWTAFNKTYNDYFDLDIQGFLVTRSVPTREILEAYAQMTPVGLATNWNPGGNDVVDGMSVVRSVDVNGGTNQAVQAITNACSKMGVGSASGFLSCRFILNSPTDALNVWNALQQDQYKDYNFKLVDPYTFYKLHNLQYGG